MIPVSLNNMTTADPTITPVYDRTPWVASTLTWSAKHSFKLHGDLTHKGSCHNDTHLFSLAENDSDKRILHKGSAHTGCVWLSQMLDHSGNLVDRVGYDDRYIGKDGKPTSVK